jgi:hypothetical protein
VTTTPNTKLWDELKRVPPDQLKQFSRSGGFKGTAIKPMWSFHRMTEIFGPCGQGWGIEPPSFITVPAGDEILVYCTVAVWHTSRTHTVFGVGGDKVRVVQSSGPRNDDEAFKKAYTDAITNALKLIGVGADIHMGLWDGNKYATPSTDPDMPDENSSVDKKSKANARADYTKLEAGLRTIRDTGTLDDLKQYLSDNKVLINSLPDEWYTMLMDEKDAVKATLSVKASFPDAVVMSNEARQ